MTKVRCNQTECIYNDVPDIPGAEIGICGKARIYNHKDLADFYPQCRDVVTQ